MPYKITTSFSRTLPLWLWLDDKFQRYVGLRSMFSTQRIHCDNVSNAVHGNGGNAGGVQGVCIKIHTLSFLKINFIELETTGNVLAGPHLTPRFVGTLLFVRQVEIEGSHPGYPTSMVREIYPNGVCSRLSNLFASDKVSRNPEAGPVEEMLSRLEEERHWPRDAANDAKCVRDG